MQFKPAMQCGKEFFHVFKHETVSFSLPPPLPHTHLCIYFIRQALNKLMWLVNRNFEKSRVFKKTWHSFLELVCVCICFGRSLNDPSCVFKKKPHKYCTYSETSKYIKIFKRFMQILLDYGKSFFKIYILPVLTSKT